MTIAEEIPKSGPYTCNGALRTWDYTFTLPNDDTDDTYLNLYVIDSEGTRTLITENFSVNVATKEITYPVPGPINPIAAGNTIEIRLEEPISNTYDPTIGQWDAVALGEQTDKTIRLIQQMQVKINDLNLA